MSELIQSRVEPVSVHHYDRKNDNGITDIGVYEVLKYHRAGNYVIQVFKAEPWGWTMVGLFTGGCYFHRGEMVRECDVLLMHPSQAVHWVDQHEQLLADLAAQGAKVRR
jgi:hypothetical protein